MKSIILYTTAVAVLSACYTPRYVYSPSAHTIAAFTQKNQQQLTGGLSVSGLEQRCTGGDFQGAATIYKHWFVQASYSFRNEYSEGAYQGFIDSAFIRYRRRQFAGTIGFFKPLNSNKSAFFQLSAGYTAGRFSMLDNGADLQNTVYARFHQTNMNAFFLQPVIYRKGHGENKLGLSSRLHFIQFSKINTNYTAAEQDRYKLDSLNYNTRFFWEPCVFFKLGHKKLPGMQLETQAGFSILYSRAFVDYRFLNLMLGISWQFSKKSRKK